MLEYVYNCLGFLVDNTQISYKTNNSKNNNKQKKKTLEMLEELNYNIKTPIPCMG